MTMLQSCSPEVRIDDEQDVWNSDESLSLSKEPDRRA